MPETNRRRLHDDPTMMSLALPREMLHRLDTECQRRGVTRSALLRQVLSAALAESTSSPPR